MWKKFGFAIALLLLISPVACNALSAGKSTAGVSPTATAKSLEVPQVTESQNWVILTEEQAEEMRLASWLVECDAFWVPSADDILNLEERLPGYLSQNSHEFNRQPPVWERLDEYQRQYVGFELGGEQFIYGNYFCHSMRINWRQDWVSVDDGGDCYFQVEYEIEGGLFIMLHVNGES